MPWKGRTRCSGRRPPASATVDQHHRLAEVGRPERRGGTPGAAAEDEDFGLDVVTPPLQSGKSRIHSRARRSGSTRLTHGGSSGRGIVRVRTNCDLRIARARRRGRSARADDGGGDRGARRLVTAPNLMRTRASSSESSPPPRQTRRADRLLAASGHPKRQRDQGRLPDVEKVGERGLHAVRRQRVLGKVVRADADEVALPEQPRRREAQRPAP